MESGIENEIGKGDNGAKSNTEKSTSSIETSSTENNNNNIEILKSSTEKGGNITEILKGSTESSSIEKRISDTESIEKKLIELLTEQPDITQQQAANQLGYSKAWIRKIMMKLQKNGTIHREGSTKKGRWIVSENFD